MINLSCSLCQCINLLFLQDKYRFAQRHVLAKKQAPFYASLSALGEVENELILFMQESDRLAHKAV